MKWLDKLLRRTPVVVGSYWAEKTENPFDRPFIIAIVAVAKGKSGKEYVQYHHANNTGYLQSISSNYIRSTYQPISEQEYLRSQNQWPN